MNDKAVDMWKTLRASHIPTALLLLSMLTLIKIKKKKKRTFLMG